MGTGTGYNPVNTSDFEKTKLNKDAKGVSTTVPAGTNVSLDLTLTDDCCIAGGNAFLAKGAAAGDYVDFQIIHPNGTTIINQFVTDWYMNPDSTSQIVPTSNYPAKIPASFTLRVIYHSTGSTDVWIAINYNKEKVLE